MSALAGLWRPDGAPGVRTDCGRMLAAQAAYGPHAAAQWDDTEISLGRRLFRTLPEDRFDSGVVALSDGSRLVADVRLDNRAELEADLGLDPGRASALADSAVLAAAWTRWGEACFDRLTGDYAFALWNPRGRRLLLARDPFGRRPLHVHRARGLVAFASMPVGLHALEAVPVAPDEDRLAAFLALRAETEGGTFFKGIDRVEPGTFLALDASGGGRTHRHYVPPRRSRSARRVEDCVAAVRERLDQAVASQLRGADQGVGAQLSSGWDSAAVTATAARRLADSGARLTAFTAAPRPGYAGGAPAGRHADESVGARLVAERHANIDHVVIPGAGRSPLADLDRDIATCGRPVLNPCNHLWFNDINRAAQARGLRVLLTGDFGNVALTDDGLDGLADLAGAGDLSAWLTLARAATAAGALSWPGVLAATLEPRLPKALAAGARSLLGRPAQSPAAVSALRPGQWPDAPAHRPSGRAARRLAALTRMDLSLYAKGAVAAYGVDVRDPLTDRRLVETCLALPDAALVADGRLRGLARRVLADRLPEIFLDLPTRGYQAADWHEALGADRDTIGRDLDRLAATPAAARLIDIDRLRRLVADWPTDGWTRDAAIDGYRVVLLRALAAGRFLTRTLGSNA